MNTKDLFTRKCGFTLVEIIVAISIVMILVVSGVISFVSFRNNQALSNSFSDTISLINEAKIDTISSKEGSAYGVHFEANRVVLFKGATFLEPNPDNHELSLSPLIEISSISLMGGGADLLFNKLTGKTGQYGSLSFRVKSDISKIKIINITPSGSVDQN